MKKIALVVVRYGQEVNGGAEVHCRMLAERLLPYYQVEVLASTIKVFDKPALDYPEGEQTENGVLVRRFTPRPVSGWQHDLLLQRSKLVRRWRHILYDMKLLNKFAWFRPRWSLGLAAEIRYLEAQPSHTPDMLRFIKEHQGDYSAFIFLNYFFSQTALGCLIAPEKTILIPLAHPVRMLWYSCHTQIFTRVQHIAFNTDAERQLCSSIFGPRMSPYSLVGAGTEPSDPAEWETVRQKFGLPDQYALYVGRVTKDKLLSLIPDFIDYRKSMNPAARLVIVGGIDPDVPRPDDEGLILTGFVSEAEKSAIIRHATLIINPSIMESLSLLMLEAMENRIPALVNGRCKVMKDHCIQSGAAFWYDNPKDFRRKLHQLFTDPELRREIGAKGPEYVQKNYDWEIIIRKLHKLIESL